MEIPAPPLGELSAKLTEEVYPGRSVGGQFRYEPGATLHTVTRPGGHAAG